MTQIFDASTLHASALMREWSMLHPQLYRLLSAQRVPQVCELVPASASGPRYDMTGYEDQAWIADGMIAIVQR